MPWRVQLISCFSNREGILLIVSLGILILLLHQTPSPHLLLHRLFLSSMVGDSAMHEVIPLDDALLVPKPAILREGQAVMAVDYTWPVVLLGTAVIVMLLPSARKGVRAFSFALTYTNLWFVGGKRGRVRVRVQSFTSTCSNCFVTTSGEFTAEIVKDEDEDGGKETNHSHSNVSKCPGAARASCIVDTELVFIYGNTSVSTTGCMTALLSSQGVPEANFPVNGEIIGRGSLSGVQEEFQAWDMGTRRLGETAGLELLCGKTVIPEWASTLLEPLEIVRCKILPPFIHERNASAVTGDYDWDAEIKLRLGLHSSWKSRSREQKSYQPSAVVRGTSHTATLLKNVVRIWENPRRSAVAKVILPGEYFVSSLDVEWEEETAYLGTTSGALSVWDLEKVTCVSLVSSELGSIHAFQCESTKPKNDRWMSLSGEGSRGRVSLWDLRSSKGLVGSTAFVNAFPVNDFKYHGFEVLVRDCSNTISLRDLRMFHSSPVSWFSAEEIRSSRSITGAQTYQVDGEKWWDVCVSDLLHEEDDFGEDAWVSVQRETKDVPLSSPGIISRCFSVISSALSLSR